MRVTLRTTATSLWVSGSAGTVHTLCARVRRTRPLAPVASWGDGSLAFALRTGQDTPWHTAVRANRTSPLTPER